jgi:NAD(P)-dependent dehydrogenase (short-subunit alcohol dehydrogenase family)
MDVNTLAPIKMIEAFVDHLSRSTRKLVASVSSELGSMTSTQATGLGRSGPWLPYRVSKAALNMAHLAIQDQLVERGITAVLLHPGWVATALGGEHAPMDAAASVASLIKILDGVTPADHCKFLSYDGRIVSW